MLLLVTDAEFDQVQRVGQKIAQQQASHGFIHIGAIGLHFVQARTRKNVAQSSQWTVANRVVVGIEKIAERWMERTIVRHILRQKKSLEEPGGVRQVPFGGAGIRHGLQAVVFDRERSAQLPRRIAPDIANWAWPRCCA